MNILCIGDVYGAAGCRILSRALPGFKKLKNIDLVIVNGENSAEGNGITPASADALLACGVDVITGGNHSFRRKEVYPLLDGGRIIIRPANFPDALPGTGITVVDCGYAQVAVINIMGVVGLESLDCPFKTVDRLIECAKELGAKIIFVDFHAEATSEKRAMGFYLDGKVSAVFGTHTHVATADEQILAGGTGYITDLGMTGVDDSVLGVKKEIIIARLKDKIQDKFVSAEGDGSVSGCIFTVDRATGKTVDIERVKFS